MPDNTTVIPTLDGRKQRATIKMSSVEINTFLGVSKSFMSCATLNEDGTIHLVEMGYAMIDGHPVMEAKEKSQKVVNLRRNPQITCMVTEGTDYTEFRGVQAVGHAELITDRDYVFLSLVRNLERRVGYQYREEERPNIERAIRNRVAIKVNVDRYVSWDHRKLT